MYVVADIYHYFTAGVLLKYIIIQSWALALFFQVRSLLCAHFLTKDRYRSSAHFADFQVRSSLNCSLEKQWFALGKEHWNAKFSVLYRYIYICTGTWSEWIRAVCIVCMYVYIGHPPPPIPAWRQNFHSVQGHTTYVTVGKEKRRQSGAALQSF